MRSIITSFLLLLYVSTTFAQNQIKPVSIADDVFNELYFKSPKPIVTGKIINATPKELAELKITYALVTPFLSVQKSATEPINPDGSFKFTLDHPFPYQQVWINLGEYFYSGIYVNKGIYLQLDLAQLKKHNVDFNGKGVRFLGKDGALTNWMNNLLLYKRDRQLEISKAIIALNYQEPGYLSKLDSLHNRQELIENEFIKINPSRYSILAENERLCNYYQYTLRYMWLKRLDLPVWEKIKNHKPLIVSNYAAKFGHRLFEYAYSVKTQNQDSALNDLMGTAYADVLRLRRQNIEVKENEEQRDDKIENIHTPWVKEVLRDQYNIAAKQAAIVKATLNSRVSINGASLTGKPVAQYAFGAKLFSVSKTKAADFLAKLNQQFKGKALILDFWATWCAPCIGDMPYSLKLHHEAAGLPVEFVYLCTSSDSNMEKWKNKITELKQPGTHIFIDEPLTNELMGLFGKSGFPSYVCISSKGEVSKQLSISNMESTSLNDIKRLIQND